MAPSRSKARSKPTSRNSSQGEASVKTALKKFATQLKLAIKKGNEIELSDEILQPVNELFLRERRDYNTFSQSDLVEGIISDLNQDDIVCSRLTVPVYNTLLRLFLQTTDCPDIERGLYLLAATLYQRAHSPSSPTAKQDIVKEKENIGKHTLQPLLEFFTNTENATELRRWTGILLLQLFQGSNTNIENVELGSEESRRNLGTMLSKEANDILKMICGQVMKELVDAEIPREDLWPAGTDEEICKEFPDSSRGGRWNQLLQTYLDNIDMSENTNMFLYFVQVVSTKPILRLERPGHSAHLVMNDQTKTMTIWSSASDATFDQSLDIKLEDISTMTITATQESQLPAGAVRIDFCIEDDDDKFCIMNGASTVISQVSMTVLATDVGNMSKDISMLCPNLEVREITTSQDARTMGAREPASQISVHSSTADTPVVFRAGKPEKVQLNGLRSQKATSEPSTIDQLPPSTDCSEEISQTAQSAERPASGEYENQEKPQIVASQPSSPPQKRSTAESKVKPMKPPTQSQRSSFRNGKAPVNTVSATATETNNTEPQMEAVKEVSERGGSPGFEEKVQRLSEMFPTDPREVLRGVLVVSSGNLEMAIEQLRARQTGTSSDEAGLSATRGDNGSPFNKAEEKFDSASLISPDGNAVSTPQSRNPTTGTKVAAATSSKPMAKSATLNGPGNQDLAPAASTKNRKSKEYVVKGKKPLSLNKNTKPSTDARKKPEAVESPHPAAAPVPLEKPNNEQKPQENPKSNETDVYAIDAADKESRTATVAASKKGTKQLAMATAKDFVKKAPATTKKDTKATKAEPKKRQSAPVAMETTAAASRSKRGAAIAASQKIQETELNEDEDEIEVEEDVAESEKVQKRKSTNSQKTVESISQTKPRRTDASQDDLKPDIEVEKVQKNPVVREDSPEDVALDLEPDYYDASPKPDVAEKSQPITTKPSRGDLDTSKVSQRTNFSAKLDGLLGGIDDEEHAKHDHSKVSESMGKTDNSPFQNRKVQRRHLNQMIDQDTAGFKDNANNGSGEMVIAGNSAESAHIIEDDGTSSGQDVAVDEEAILDNVPHDKQSEQDRITEQVPIDLDQVSGGLNDSPLDEQVKPKKEASSQVVKKKAGEELQSSAKRRRAQTGAIKVNNDPLDRQWQRLGNQAQVAQVAVEALNDILSEKPLIDDRLTRKVQIVNFGAKGATNQGPPNVLRSSTIKSAIERPDKSEESPAGRKMKRTREDLNDSVTDIEVPDRPEKRQSISPEDNLESIQMDDDDDPLEYASSPPVIQPTNRRSSKPSSQASRVDQNGSPRALISAEKVDHFSKVSKKLLQGQPDDERPKSNLIFGPRPILASLPKTGPSSPRSVKVRYVKHHKLENGVYEGVETKEVVAAEKTLADPFTGGLARKSSGFTDRLQLGASKETQKPESSHLPKTRIPIPIPITQEVLDAALRKAATTAHKTFNVSKQEPNNGQLRRKTNKTLVYEDQTTLVNSETGLPSSPSGLTNGSTVEDSRSPLSERTGNSWLVAMRPHYADISTVAHRLADEVIIQLAKEEDVMGYLVDQYKENGGKLLEGVNEKRALEKARITARVEEQKKAMVGVYGEAKTFVNDSEKTIKSSSLSEFEKQWRKEQEGIQRRIYEGRDAVQ